MHKTTVVVAVALLLPGLAGAQSLTEAAVKERERRKSQAAPKVYTEDDLRRAGSLGTANVGGGAAEPSPAPAKPAGTGPAAAAKPPEKTEDELRQEQEKAWREKVQKATEEVQRLTAQANRLQQAVNDLTGNIYGAARTENLRQLEDTKAKLAVAQQQVADLQDEGRRSRFR
jgi:hypothetical protein